MAIDKTYSERKKELKKDTSIQKENRLFFSKTLDYLENRLKERQNGGELSYHDYSELHKYLSLFLNVSGKFNGKFDGYLDSQSSKYITLNSGKIKLVDFIEGNHFDNFGQISKTF